MKIRRILAVLLLVVISYIGFVQLSPIGRAVYAQTHIFCALDVACAWTATQTFANVVIGGPKPYIDITAAIYGADPTGVADTVAAFNTAQGIAEATGAPIYFPCGKYLFNSAPSHLKSGIPILGCSGPASNPAQGTTLLVNYTEGTSENAFLWWDGSSTLNASGCCNGTGGGPRHLTIQKNSGFTGGTAIKYSGTADNFRAGWDELNDVIVTSTGTGSFTHAFIIDGTCCTTAGTQGVRDHLVIGLYAFNSTTSAQTVLFKNAVHVFMIGGILASGSQGAADAGMTCTGNGTGLASSSHVYVAGMEINGSFVADFCQQFLVDNNWIGSGLSITANATNGRVGGIVQGTVTNSSTGANRVQVQIAIAGNSGTVQTIGNSMGASFDSTATTTQAGRLYTRDGATSGTVSYGDGTCFTAMSAALAFNFNCGTSAVFSFPSARLIVGGSAPAGMNNGDIAAVGSSTTGTVWLGSDALAFITRNAGGDVNVKQNLGFRSGTSFIGTLTAALTAPRTYTFPDAAGTLPSTLNCGTTSTCSQATDTRAIIVRGGPIALVAGTITITSMPYTGATTYVCSPDDSTGINGIDVIYNSGASVTFNGTGTDSIRYSCTGN